jgi:hypothetical protein
MTRTPFDAFSKQLLEELLTPLGTVQVNRVEILITGEYPGDGKPKPVQFPDPAIAAIDRDGIQVIQHFLNY